MLDGCSQHHFPTSRPPCQPNPQNILVERRHNKHSKIGNLDKQNNL